MNARFPHITRRSFLEKSALLAGAATVLSPWELAAAISRGVVLSAADLEVRQFLSTYSPSFYLTGGSVAGKMGSSPFQIASVLVEVTDGAALERAWSQASFSGVYNKENVFAFVYRGGFYALEHLPPTEFLQRLSDMSAGRNIAYAHDALSYDLANGARNDPFTATKRGATLTLLNAGPTLADNVAQLLRGLFDRAVYRLASGDAFTDFQTRTLAQTADATSAPLIAKNFLAMLPALAAAMNATDLSAVLNSPAIAASLATRGISSSDASANFAQRRAAASSSASDAAIWMIALHGRAGLMQQAAIPNVRLEPFAFLQARMALAEARALVSAESKRLTN